jgi:hypothetical protein
MTLDDADWEKMGKLLDKKLNSVVGKRLTRLEIGYNSTTRYLRTSVVESVKDRHDRILRAMFTESSLLVVSPLVEGNEGKLSRPPPSCSQGEIVDTLKSIPALNDIKFEIEPSDVGFRLLMASWSPQTRRRSAAAIIRHARDTIKDNLGLYVQYDKPYELRTMQREAYKFLSVVKRLGGSAIEKKELKGGFIVINGVRFAPEYLVPGPAYWDKLAEAVVTKIKGWRGRPPSSPTDGVMTCTFGHFYASFKGVVELEDIEVLEEDGMNVG